MDASLKKILKPVTLELRHLLEGHFDTAGTWYPGDLEERLASIGVRRDRAPRPIDELALSTEDLHARKVVDAYLKLREEAGVKHSEAVVEFLRETAYTWANRLIALRCMESRELIDPVILQQDAYGGRSLEHHRLAQRQPELCAGEDDGLFAVLDKVFREQTERLPMLFNPQAPGIALRPSPAAIKDSFGLLSLNLGTLQKYRIRIREEENALPDAEPPNPFVAPDALGWTYQYWNTEEKQRVFDKVRTVKGTKIAGADIVPATQLYTEDYMVKFLVQNSLGATWMAMHPDSTLSEHWEYYVRDADRAPAALKPVRDITFLDPACGSGHFLIEAFDLFYVMYHEEGELTEPEEICTAILTQNLFGIDIDARAVQIAEAALWMKAAERSFDYSGAATNLVAATASHLKGPAWEEFLESFTMEPSIGRVLRKFAQTMEHIDEIGSLARPAEDLQAIIQEEHATWEQQVRDQKEANFLFPEMREEALSSQLAFNEISDEEFGDRLFYRARAGIDTFTERARESGEFDDQMIASETRTGFRLVDLLSRQYDVVAANPPYMGSKNMGPALKKYVQTKFKAGKRDLYAAFLLQSLRLTSMQGHTALITQQYWMSNRYYQDLRCSELPHSGILRASTMQVLAHLGANAFEEITGEVVSVAMAVFQVNAPVFDHICTIIRLVDQPDCVSKARGLRSSAGSPNSRTYRISQERLLAIPGAPVVYWLPPTMFLALSESSLLPERAIPYEGCHPTDTARFVRFFWEVDRSIRWSWYSRGGEFCRWFGLKRSKIETQDEFSRHRATQKAIIPSRDKYYVEAVTYTDFASGNMAARILHGDEIFSDAAPAVIPIESGIEIPLLALLNSRVVTVFMRVLSPSPQHFRTGYLAKVPLPSTHTHELLSIERACVSLKGTSVATDPTERSFNSIEVASYCRSQMSKTLLGFRLAAALHACETVCEMLIYADYKLNDSDIAYLEQITGVPCGKLPLVVELGDDPATEIAEALECLTQVLMEHGIECPPLLQRMAVRQTRIIDKVTSSTLRSTIRGLFIQNASNAAYQDETELEQSTEPDEDEEGEGEVEDIGVPIPSQTLIETISRTTGIHPLSVYRIVRHGVENDGWRCVGFEARAWLDHASVIVLSQFGFRWPNDSAEFQSISDVTVLDGLVPITPLANSTTLVERVRQKASGDNYEITQFAEVIGKPIETWLATEFFKYHTTQFKRRPIAWQVQSGSFTTRSTPAIACLIYYHKLDSDLLRKVRKMAEDLRKSRETELRGIITVAPEARSDRQEARRVELEDTIAELQRFDTTLESVATSGFGPESLRPKLRQYALDDAMLAMKACWLSRLSDQVHADPLQDWLKAAAEASLHPDLGRWITSAMLRLEGHCAQVGPQAPDQSELETDPTAVELAAIIGPEAASIHAKALFLACEVWWSQLDRAVFAPLKEQIKQLKAEQKECEAILKSEPEPDEATTRRLKARVKELKAEVKSLDKRLKEQTTKAKQVREQIEGWKSDEPATWGEWLAEQPMFDRISSLDRRRPAPKTIAEFIAQESLYAPDINDGVRVNIAPLQRASILAADVLAAKDLDKAIADRAEWRSDERRWVREGKLPQPGWWPEHTDQQ
jgi:hypothetical protein